MFDRVAKLCDKEPRHYKVKESEQGPEADQWQKDMAAVAASQHACFLKYCPQIAYLQQKFIEKNKIKYTMETAPHFGNMAVTFNFYCAKHFDNDHSWACGVWYNEVQLSQAQCKRHSIPKSCGGHFVVPTLGVACDLTAPATFILWNGSRHLHATAIMKPHHMVSQTSFHFYIVAHSWLCLQTRIGTSMQITSRHVKHETGADFYWVDKLQ